MAAWPSILPGPLKTLNVTRGRNVKNRKTQSGRIEMRRFGSGAPDQMTAVFRIRNEHVETFSQFYSRDTNMGLNWFTADWLPLLGYTSHCARFLGYPERRGKDGMYSEFSVGMLVMNAAGMADDVFWPSAGPGTSGGGGSEETVEGLVVFWGSYLYDEVPDGLKAVKVDIVHVDAGSYMKVTFGVALQSDGTLQIFTQSNWESYIDSALSGWDSLGDIIDIEADANGLYYLTSVGSIGHLGDPISGTDYPTTLGWKKFLRAPYYMKGVVDADGVLTTWCYSSYESYRTALGLDGLVIPQPHKTGIFSIGYYSAFARSVLVDANGVAYFYGRRTSQPGALPYAGSVCAGIGGYNYNQYSLSVYTEDGTWYEWDENDSYSDFNDDRPSGLSPSLIQGGSSGSLVTYIGAAIHSDGQLVVWNWPTITAWTTASTDIYAHDIIFRPTRSYSNGSAADLKAIAIQKEDE